MAKVWIIKFALTEGVFEVEAVFVKNFFSRKMAAVKNNEGNIVRFYNSEFHTTKKQATDRAEQMRTSKIKTLKNQIKRLSALRFE